MKQAGYILDVQEVNEVKEIEKAINDVSLDEKIYYLINSDRYKVEAMGVKLFDDEDYLVGLYMFWDNYKNPKHFLKDIVREFGEAYLYAPNKNSDPGLVCKMNFDEPNLSILVEKAKNYRDIKLDLLEMRASNPKPFLALNYDSKKKIWNYEPVLNKSGKTNSDYELVL